MYGRVLNTPLISRVHYDTYSMWTQFFCKYEFVSFITAWKVSVFGVFLVRIFQHSDCIRRDTPERYSVSLRIQFKYGKIRIRKTPNADDFHVVYFCNILRNKKMSRWISYLGSIEFVFYIYSKTDYIILIKLNVAYFQIDIQSSINRTRQLGVKNSFLLHLLSMIFKKY